MISETLSHYYREAPFQTLSELSPADAAPLLFSLAGKRRLPYRLRHPEYLRRRRAIEQRMRRAFVEKGGQPRRQHPHYMILGRSTHWEILEPNVVTVPLAALKNDAVSFTYTDSFYTYSATTLRGIPIPAQPHRGKVYCLDELDELVAAFGLPPGYDDPDERFDLYIEAQIWDDAPLDRILAAGGK